MTDLEREDERHPVELLAEEFSQRLRAGERPTVDEYASQHPGFAEDIRALFPAIKNIENAKDGSGSGVRLASGSAPDRLGDYRIIREVGRGGMGIVYEAEQTSLKRRVAVKVISGASLLSDTQVRRFEREARAAANLHHTNIVPVFGIGENDGLRYYVMQYIRGRSLHEILEDERGRRLSAGTTLVVETCRPTANSTAGDLAEPPGGSEPWSAEASSEGGGALLTGSCWREVARIGVQVADALDYAHSQGILHRDIKPANLLMDEARTVWVTDFGLAKLDKTGVVDESGDVTKTGDVVGTLRYLAPERFHGEGDARADIYSLGLTLYELVTLQPPFEDTTPAKLIRQVTQGRPVRPRKTNPAVPRDLETVILKATAPNPDHRYGTAAEFRDDLQAFYEDRPIQARRASSVERVWRWGRRNPVVAALSSTSVVLLALVAVVATVGYLRTDRALDAAFHEKQKAQANLRLALDAFEEIFSQVNSAGLTVGGDWSGEESEEGGDPSFPPVVSEELVAILQRLLTFYERFAETNTEDPGLKLQMARAHHRVGDIQHHFGEFELAETAYRRGLQVYDELTRAGDDLSQRWLERVQIRNSLGLLFAVGERRDEARRAHQQALDVLEALPENVSASATARFESACTHAYFAQMRRFSGRRRGGGASDAGEHRRAALETLRSLVAEEPSVPEYRATLGRVCRDQRFRRRRPDTERRVDFRAEAVRIFAELQREYPSNPDYTHELALTYAEQGRPRGWNQDATEKDGVENLEEAIRLGLRLVRHYPGVPRYTLSLARHELWLTERLAFREEGAKGSHLEVAGERVQDVIRYVEPLFERSPSNPSYAYYWGKAKLYSGTLQARRGELATAREIFSDTAEELEGSLKLNRDRRNVGLYLSVIDEWAALLQSIGAPEEAIERQAAAQVWREAESGRRRFWRVRLPKGGDSRGPRRGGRSRGQNP